MSPFPHAPVPTCWMIEYFLKTPSFAFCVYILCITYSTALPAEFLLCFVPLHWLNGPIFTRVELIKYPLIRS
jgi:hypothetical protein